MGIFDEESIGHRVVRLSKTKDLKTACISLQKKNKITSETCPIILNLLKKANMRAIK